MFLSQRLREGHCIQTKPEPRSCATTCEEMPAFFALNDLFGIKSLPETRVYWSKDNFVSVPTVQKVKPRNRFDKIRQYLSLNNRLYTQDDPGYVKLFKVRSSLDRLDSRIHEEYQPSKFISIDEWPSTREDGFKQYKHMKPVKRGSKVWVRSDATNGFVSTMQVYTGKKSGGQPKHGLGNRDVSDLVSDLMGKNYHIFCDNFFTSVRLAEDCFPTNCTFAEQHWRNCLSSVRKHCYICVEGQESRVFYRYSMRCKGSRNREKKAKGWNVYRSSLSKLGYYLGSL